MPPLKFFRKYFCSVCPQPAPTLRQSRALFAFVIVSILFLNVYLAIYSLVQSQTPYQRFTFWGENGADASDFNRQDEELAFDSPFVLTYKWKRFPASKVELPKLILWYNLPPWRKSIQRKLHFRLCSVRDFCQFTENRSRFEEAEVVVFHTDNFYLPDPPSNRPNGQIWVSYTMEPPNAYDRRFANPAWKSVFNWTLTYRLDADLVYPYGYLVRRRKSSRKNYTAIAVGKSRTAAWFVHHCYATSRRQDYVVELQKYVTVDVYGDCGNFSCPHSVERKCLDLLSSNYSFYLAFENNLCKDYVTEKFFKIFKRNTDTIPVVRGGADYKKYFPPGTFINTADFKSPKQLAGYLKKLESDPLAYAAMLERKDRYGIFKPGGMPCKMCEMLHYRIEEKTYPDLGEWYGKNICSPVTDIIKEPWQTTDDLTPVNLKTAETPEFSQSRPAA